MTLHAIARRTMLAAGLAGLGATSGRAADRWDVPAAGVREEMFVELGGISQWVTIRGEDRANPVLMLIGGAGNAFGAPFSPFVRTFQPWERRYTLVQWDPQGTGKTFARAGRTIPDGVTLETLVTDGLALVDHIRARIGCSDVVALGVCGGSTVALKMIGRRPKAFSAFVSSGMVTAPPKVAEQVYLKRLRRRVAERADPGDVAKLAELGDDPLGDPVRRADLFKLGAKYRPPNPADQTREVLSAPNWSLLEAASIPAGIKASWDRFGPHWEAVDLPALPREIPVPVALLYGEDNDIQPTAMAKAWLDRIRAPAKVWATIPVAGNHVMETHTEAYLALLERHVRRLAVKTLRSRP